MNDDSIFHNRHYARVDWHDYNDGLYFVTFNTLNKVHYLGYIEDSKMHYSEIGNKLVADILNIPKHYSDIIIDEWVVMPNHAHLIIRIGHGDSLKGIKIPCDRSPIVKVAKRSRLSSVIGNLKSGVKRYANKQSILFEWNPRFYEHIIRSSDSYHNIKEYIKNNIKKWDGLSTK